MDATERLHFHFSLSCIGEGNGNPLQCSCLENPRDGGASWAAVYGIAQSRTRLKRLSSSSSSRGPGRLKPQWLKQSLIKTSIITCPYSFLSLSTPSLPFPGSFLKYTPHTLILISASSLMETLKHVGTRNTSKEVYTNTVHNRLKWKPNQSFPGMGCICTLGCIYLRQCCTENKKECSNHVNLVHIILRNTVRALRKEYIRCYFTCIILDNR